MIKRSGFVCTLLLILLQVLLLAGLSEPAGAQKASEPAAGSEVVKEMSAEKVGIDASELLARINATAEDAQGYLDEMKAASEEDRLVIQLQITFLQQRIMDDVHQLSDALLEQEKKGKQPELRRQVETLLSRIPPRLWFHINRLRGEIDAVRARRTKAPAEERPAIENEVVKLTTRLDRMYEMSLAHVEKMAKVGLDTKKERDELTQLLVERADELSGRIALATDRIADLKALRKEISDDADVPKLLVSACLLYTSDAADDTSEV